MTLFECLKVFLAQSSTLAAKVGTDIYPELLPQGQSGPLVVIRLLPGLSDKPTHDGGASPWSDMRIEFTVWGQDFVVCEQGIIDIQNLFKTLGPAGYLAPPYNGRYTVMQTNGPRSCHDDLSKLIGVQLDVIGKLNSDSLS